MGPHSSKHHDHHRRRSVPNDARAAQPARLAATKSDTMMNVTRHDLSKLAVIAVIFNPVKYRSRYDHYHRFEAHMAESGVTLFTVECIFDSAERFDLPKQHFEITQRSNPRHLQITASSILWMKENLINVAIQVLPPSFEYIAWIDADIEFDRLDWPHRTITELQRYPIVQLFELSFFLGPGGKGDVLRRDYSFGYSIRHNKPINPQRFNEWYAHPGYGWAMRRSALTRIGGLLDFCIVGSGDLHFAFALLDRIEETIRPGLNYEYRQLAILWGKRVAEVALCGADVGYVPVNIWHHWHGERSDRSYVDRWAILERHQFSPTTDLEKNNDSGLIRLKNPIYIRDSNEISRIQALERDLVVYFKSRNEDKPTKSVPPPMPQPAVRPKPLAPARAPAQRSGGGHHFKLPHISAKPWKGHGGLHLWTSGPAGSHVDDHNPYPPICICPDHCHHPDNHMCPCSPHHHDDQHCWNPTDHDHSHPEPCWPTDEHHHDHHGGHCDEDHSGHAHDHDHHDYSHGGGDYTDHSHGGGDYTDHSYGGDGGEYGGGGTDYGGPGSFY